MAHGLTRAGYCATGGIPVYALSGRNRLGSAAGGSVRFGKRPPEGTVGPSLGARRKGGEGCIGLASGQPGRILRERQAEGRFRAVAGHRVEEAVERRFALVALARDPRAAQRKCRTAEKPEVGGRIPVPDAALVLLEPRAVEALVGSVLDIPVVPFPPQQLFGAHSRPAREQEHDAVVLRIRAGVGPLHEHRGPGRVREADLLGADAEGLYGPGLDPAAVEFNALQQVRPRGGRRPSCGRRISGRGFCATPSGWP